MRDRNKQWLNWARMIDSLKDDKCSSHWIKEAAVELNSRDCVDVLNDLQLLTRIFDAKFYQEMKASEKQTVS